MLGRPRLTRHPTCLRLHARSSFISGTRNETECALSGDETTPDALGIVVSTSNASCPYNFSRTYNVSVYRIPTVQPPSRFTTCGGAVFSFPNGTAASFATAADVSQTANNAVTLPHNASQWCVNVTQPPGQNATTCYETAATGRVCTPPGGGGFVFKNDSGCATVSLTSGSASLSWKFCPVRNEGNHHDVRCRSVGWTDRVVWLAQTCWGIELGFRVACLIDQASFVIR